MPPPFRTLERGQVWSKDGQGVVGGILAEDFEVGEDMLSCRLVGYEETRDVGLDGDGRDDILSMTIEDCAFSYAEAEERER